MDAKGSGRACIFCGSPANSKEHLLPRWLESILPADEQVIHTRQVGDDEPRRWEAKPFGERSKIVCESCNHGWMSKLEEASKPLLTPAITRSGPCEFDGRGQWVAAVWALKTCYVIQAQSRQLLAPQIHPVLLKLNWKPPPQASVWIGSHHRGVQDPLNSICIQKPISLEAKEGHFQKADDFGYMAFLAIGGVSFLVVEHRYNNSVDITLGRPSSELLQKIWPRENDAVPWPPPMQMDRELIDLVFDADVHPPQMDIQVGSGLDPTAALTPT